MSNSDGNRFWLWGYVLDTVPGTAMFVDHTTSCSLETGAEYLGCDNILWMNSLHTLAEPSKKTGRISGILSRSSAG